MKERLSYIDNVAGIMICFMMLIHILLLKKISLAADSFLLEPLQFFMFWFFYKSGMFFRQKTRQEAIIGRGKKLLAPFIFFSFIGYIVNVIFLVKSGDYNWIHYVLTPIKEFLIAESIGGNDVLWFLTSLFMVQVLYNELMLHRVNPWVVIFSGFFLAFSFHCFGVTRPDYLSNITLGIAVYALGNQFKDIQFSNKFGIISFVCYAGILCCMPSHINFRTNELSEGGYYLGALLFSVSGCILINNIFKHIPRIPLLSSIGKHSMVFYVTHMLLLNGLTMLMEKNINGSIQFAIMCLACLTLPPCIECTMKHYGLEMFLGISTKK